MADPAETVWLAVNSLPSAELKEALGCEGAVAASCTFNVRAGTAALESSLSLAATPPGPGLRQARPERATPQEGGCGEARPWGAGQGWSHLDICLVLSLEVGAGLRWKPMSWMERLSPWGDVPSIASSHTGRVLPPAASSTAAPKQREPIPTLLARRPHPAP